MCWYTISRERDQSPYLDRRSASRAACDVWLVCISVVRPFPNHDLFLLYLPSLAPSVNPGVTIHNLTPNSFSLKWQDYASDFQSGFIKGYLVYLKSKELQCNPNWERTVLSGDAHPLGCLLRLKRPPHSLGVMKARLS